MASARDNRPPRPHHLLYPRPVRAVYEPRDADEGATHRPNPRLLGWALVLFTFLLENIGFLQRLVRRNAGFDSLSALSQLLSDVEPRYDPTVIPLAAADESVLDTSKRVRPSSAIDLSPPPSSVSHYHALYRSRAITPTAVADVLLPIISNGPHSAAWVEVHPELVRKAAHESTLRYSQGVPLGPLDGVFVAIKDEFDVQGYATRIGCRIAPDTVKTVDNWCVEKLKEAGAVIVGKATMVEFGLDTSGINPHYGTPNNPYSPRYYTGGSSSGGAYAVSTGLVPVALGSDAGGSIRIPASFCSVTGLRSTHGRLSFMPGINHVSTNSIGPIAADVSSLAAFYSVISQPHPTSPLPRTLAMNLQQQQNPDGGPRLIGIPEAWFQLATPAIQTLCRRVIEHLETSKGFRIVPIEMPFTREGRIATSVTVLADAAAVIPRNSGLSPTSRILLALGRGTLATDYCVAQKLRHLLMQHLAWLWSEHPGMVIVTPTTRCAGWPMKSAAELTHGLSDGDRTVECMEYTWLANFCGLPSISMPAGYVVADGSAGAGEIASGEATGDRVPVGIMATGEWGSEGALLQVAKDVEDVNHRRLCRPPTWVDVVALAKEEMNKEHDKGVSSDQYSDARASQARLDIGLGLVVRSRVNS